MNTQIDKYVHIYISTLVSIGAPRRLAIDIALEHGLTIVGFAKNNNLTVYTGPTRIKDE